MSCIFCAIVAGTVEARKVHEDAEVLAFNDINPQAPTHILMIPKRHIESLLDLAPEDDALIGSLVRKARDLARGLGLAKRGFRLVLNAGPDAGYSVYHVHLHLLGGRRLSWPPG
jgi:histidine triad (HIT) family protein